MRVPGGSPEAAAAERRSFGRAPRRAAGRARRVPDDARCGVIHAGRSRFRPLSARASPRRHPVAAPPRAPAAPRTETAPLADDAPDLRYDTDLLVVLTDAARLVRTLADRRARAQGMTRAQWLILFRLRSRPGLTQRELAVLLEVEPITVGRLVDRLAARGLVERRADPADRRVWRLHLTPDAAPVLAEIDAARASFDAEATQGLGAEQRAAVIAALLHMKANLQASAGGAEEAEREAAEPGA